MTPREIASLLAQDVERVCAYLLPGGKREGAEWRAGSTDGEKGQSLGVHLTGTKAGVWADFNGGAAGDLLDLWAAVRHCSIAEAISEAKDYLGIAEPRFVEQKKVFRRPEKPDVTVPRSRVLQYLVTTRCLSSDALKAYRVAATKDDTEIVFPYLRDGELVNVKYLAVERDAKGKKIIRLEKDAEPCLFGWQAIPANAREVVLCEGELDSLSLWQYGRPALSVFSGAGNHTWIEGEYDNLSRFDVIYLCFDMDEPGRKGCREVAERLGLERCRVVELPAKDANECLKSGITREAIDACFATAKTQDPTELRSAADFTDDVIREFYPQEGDRTGFETPWSKLNGKLRFRPEEVVLVNGFSGHGKTQLVGQIVLFAMAQGERACVASLEIPPRRWLRWLDQQATGQDEPTLRLIRCAHEWFAGRLWVYDHLGSAQVDRVIEVFTYASRRYGITVFVVDSLLKLGIGEDDFNKQKFAVEKLCSFANQYHATVFLVTHNRKGDSERDAPPDKMGVRGSAAITDQARTVLSIWRNQAKEEDFEAHHKEPDAILYCTKQTYHPTGWQGKAWLWFHKVSHQFTETDCAGAHRYVELPQREPGEDEDEAAA